MSRPTPSKVVVVIVGTIAMAMSCHAPRAVSDHAQATMTSAQRLEALSRAQLWAHTDVAAMNLKAGPQGQGALPPFAKVSCDYVKKEMGGSSPKFTCVLNEAAATTERDGAVAVGSEKPKDEKAKDPTAAPKDAKDEKPRDEVKIKYGADNPEVYGVVAATRLLWALGFGADRWYPVSVTCHGCPVDPKKDQTPTAQDVTFDIAALERPVSGHTLETHLDEGWAWPELSKVSAEAGGAPLAQREALELLAVMLQHSDSKPEQQRLTCLDETREGPCALPFMYVHDLGLTFGKANAFNANAVTGPNFENWTSQHVWKHTGSGVCVGNLPKSWTGTIDNPEFHDAGRQFLADLLVQLTDAQLNDLFDVARFPLRSHRSAAEWTAAFKAKRDEIVQARCGR
jgi:hypothetical protein